METDEKVRFVSAEDGFLTAVIGGEIDHNRAMPLRKKIDEELVRAQPAGLCLDMAGVGFMDSSGLGLILGRYTKTCQLGIGFRVQNPSACVKKMLELAGTDKLIAVVYSQIPAQRKEQKG